MTMPRSVLTDFKRQIQKMEPAHERLLSTKEVVGFQTTAFEMYCVAGLPNRPLQGYFSLYKFPFYAFSFFYVNICELYISMRTKQF